MIELEQFVNYIGGLLLQCSKFFIATTTYAIHL